MRPDLASYDRVRRALAMLKLLSLSEDDVAAGRLYTTDAVLETLDRGSRAR